MNYCISGNFLADLILAFIMTSFKLQIIEHSEIISCIIFIRNFLNREK